MRRLAAASLLVVLAAGCGSSAPTNGRIYAWKWSEGLYAMNPDGSGLHKVVDLPRDGVAPMRLGKWILYERVVPVTTPEVDYIRSDLWKMRDDGSARRLVARNVSLDALSPDDRTIAYSGDSCLLKNYDAGCYDVTDNPAGNSMELYTIDVDGTHRRRLTRNQAYDGDPSWSPDGKFIAFATDNGIRIMRRDGSDVRYVTHRDGLSVPTWSSRGDRLLMSDFGTRWRVISTDGKTLHLLDPGPAGPTWGPVWSPDGRQIAYLARATKSWSAETPLQVWVMNADGRDRHPITRSVGWIIASWAPAS